MPKRKGNPSEGPQMPGAFMPDGCWNPRADLTQRGPVHKLVEALCHERRLGQLSPARAVELIEAAKAGPAFPSRRFWGVCEKWRLVPTTTSAEDAVKRCGRSAVGRWNGEEWVSFDRGGTLEKSWAPI